MDVLMTLVEVSNFTRMSKPTLYRYIHEGTIPYLKIGHRVLFEPKALKNWLETKKRGTWKEDKE